MKRSVLPILFLFLLFGLLQGLYSQSFDFRSYSVAEGLAQSQVYSLLEDQRGYLWLGTQGGGISRFDGQKFTNFSTANTPGLSNNYLLSLLEDRAGNLWFGTKNGITRYDGLEFQMIPLVNQQEVEVYDLLQTLDGQIWAATSAGLYR
ncbi:MAG: two-component regulator propeller domain-containing protein, partial [Bacteroidota bacterium]